VRRFINTPFHTILSHLDVFHTQRNQK
jgi:hypothetical protein